ncbi:MAG: hypothetical protein Q8K04_01590 [Lutibacter sp.]|nr:hypothetical protein [Lutibacter sp.]MDP3944936.1 hypothetical protein [Lutibacter sp.]
MEENKKSNTNLIIIALAVLLLVALAYTFYTSSEHKKLTDEIEVEKLEIEQNLDSMIVRYEDAIAEKTSVSGDLIIERDRIIALRDSIKDLKVVNYSMLRRYKGEISKLEESNKKLFLLNESLTSSNRLLTTNLDSAKVVITRQLAKNDTLTTQNLTLAQKVAIGSELKISTIKVLAMKERSNGKLVETPRANNTDALRINLTIVKNDIAEKGDRQVYIQIVDAQGKTVSQKGTVTLYDNTQVNYSDLSIVNYMNEAIDLISLVEVKRDLMKTGVYTVNIYIENKFVGATKISLK